MRPWILTAVIGFVIIPQHHTLPKDVKNETSDSSELVSARSSGLIERVSLSDRKLLDIESCQMCSGEFHFVYACMH